MRLLVWIALIVLVMSAVRTQLKKVEYKRPKKAEEVVPEPMIQCAQCGVHFPASEAVTEAGAVYCSEEHRRMSSSS